MKKTGKGKQKMKNFSVEDILKEVFIGKRIKETEFVPDTENEREYYKDKYMDFPSYGKRVIGCRLKFNGEDTVVVLMFEDYTISEFYTNDTFTFMED
jgi:hypothetical protein